MRTVVERADLAKSLGHVHRVVERRNTIPILGNVLLRADGARLELKATDLDLEVVECDRCRRAARRRHHCASAHVLRHRAQAAGGRRRFAGGRRRQGHAGDPGRPRPLPAADAAGIRLSRPHRRRVRPPLRAQRLRPQAAGRQDPVRHLDRGDALLSQRHLSPHRVGRGRRDAAGGRHRRPSPRPDRARRRRPVPSACPA